MHALLLSVYDRHDSAGDEVQSTAPWSRDLSVTFRAPQSTNAGSGQDMLENKQMKIDARLVKGAPTERIDGGNESPSVPLQTDAPLFSSGAGGNTAESGSSPAVDIDAARHIARQMARAQGQNPTRQLPRQGPSAIERETALGQAIARSSRSDCRSAYAGAGFFAIPFLIRDAITDNGCRW